MEKLQKLEPCGVFARNLGECLRIQLKEKKLLNESNYKLTENLELLAKGEIKKLCKITSLTEKMLSVEIKSTSLHGKLQIVNGLCRITSNSKFDFI